VAAQPELHQALSNSVLRQHGFLFPSVLPRPNAAGFNRRMRKTACPVVWEGAGAQSPALHPIHGPAPRM